jgi:hypothetical protein
MTVATTTSRVEYSGNAVTLAFSVPFYFLANADLKVFLAGALQTLTTHYSVSGAGNPAGGTVTFVTAPGSGAAVVVLRDPAVVQQTDYAPNDPFPAESHEQALDKLTMIAQRLTERAGRSVAFPDGYVGGASPALPPPVANQFLRWNATPDALENADVLSQGLIGVPVPVASGGHGSTTAAGGRKALGSRFLRLEDYGGGVAVANNTPALDALVADMAAQQIRVIQLDTGIYNFTTRPAAFTKEVILIGEGMSNTVLARSYSEGGGNDVGFLNWHGSACNGGGLRDLMVLARNGTSGGTLVKFSTGAADPAGYHKLENVVMTYEGTGAYHRCLFVDGSLNTTPGSQGLRDFHAVHVWMFARNLTDETARFLNAVAFSALGVWTSGVVTVFGGGTATSNSTQGRLDIESLANVFVGNSKLIAVNGTVDTLIFSTGTEQCHFSGVIQVITGGFSDSGTNNIVHTLEPWQTYTPTVTAGSGTITTASATGRYLKRGRRVDVQIRVTITTNGTGATSVNATLPFSSANVTGIGRTLAGREETSTGHMLQGFISPNSTVVQIRSYDNTYPGATGRTLHVNGTYEVD